MFGARACHGARAKNPPTTSHTDRKKCHKHAETLKNNWLLTTLAAGYTMYPKGGKKMKIKPRTRRPAAPAVVYPNTRKRDNTFCNKEYSPPPCALVPQERKTVHHRRHPIRRPGPRGNRKRRTTTAVNPQIQSTFNPDHLQVQLHIYFPIYLLKYL